MNSIKMAFNVLHIVFDSVDHVPLGHQHPVKILQLLCDVQCVLLELSV